MTMPFRKDACLHPERFCRTLLKMELTHQNYVTFESLSLCIVGLSWKQVKHRTHLRLAAQYITPSSLRERPLTRLCIFLEM